MNDDLFSEYFEGPPPPPPIEMNARMAAESRDRDRWSDACKTIDVIVRRVGESHWAAALGGIHGVMVATTLRELLLKTDATSEYDRIRVPHLAGDGSIAVDEMELRAGLVRLIKEAPLRRIQCARDADELAKARAIVTTAEATLRSGGQFDVVAVHQLDRALQKASAVIEAHKEQG